MSNNNRLDHARQPRGEAVAVRGTESLVVADEEFTNRLQQRALTLRQRLMPTKIERKTAEIELRMVGLAGDAKVEGYRMYLECQRQAVKETLEAFLAEGKIKSRREQTEFFNYNARELQQSINDSTATYFNDMDRRLTELENSGHHASIRKRHERMLEDRLDEFERNITLLMTRFASIPEEGV
jgi:hypothetical protein